MIIATPLPKCCKHSSIPWQSFIHGEPGIHTQNLAGSRVKAVEWMKNSGTSLIRTPLGKSKVVLLVRCVWDSEMCPVYRSVLILVCLDISTVSWILSPPVACDMFRRCVRVSLGIHETEAGVITRPSWHASEYRWLTLQIQVFVSLPITLHEQVILDRGQKYNVRMHDTSVTQKDNTTERNTTFMINPKRIFSKKEESCTCGGIWTQMTSHVLSVCSTYATDRWVWIAVTNHVPLPPCCIITSLIWWKSTYTYFHCPRKYRYTPTNMFI